MTPPLSDQRWVRPAIVWLAVFVLANALDRPVYRLLLAPGTRDDDFTQVFRQLGYLPTWIIIAGLLWILDAQRPPMPRGLAATPPPRPAHHRAGLVILAAALAGLAANILKPVIGRLRPDENGLASFAPRPEFLWAQAGEHGFGLPSGHTSVAFAACGMLALLVPVWRVPMLALATGCALTRLLAGAHALSDTVAGAGLGLAIAWILYAAGEGRRRGAAGGLIPRA